MAIKAKTNPRQLSFDRPYLTRETFVHPARLRPGVQDTDRWRTVAAEPINRMARRMVQREISSLNFTIRPEDPKDAQQRDAADWYLNVYSDFRNLVTRTLKSVCELPQGGAWEVGYIRPGVYGEGEKGTLAFVQYIDGGTLHPSISQEFPIVQVDPTESTRNVMFREDEIVRLLAWPRDEFGLEWWQESPTEASYMAIEALARIYVYSLKQLMDTPIAGILDMMDFSEEDARTWANTFREMLEGIDPIKIPILYQHEHAASWIPMGNRFEDLAITEQFKIYADLILGNYGLSVNDLRIFNHDGPKTGMAVSRKISIQQGVSFFAELVKDAVQSTLPRFLIFEYTEPDLEDERTKSQIGAADARTIQTFDWLDPKLKAKEAIGRGVLKHVTQDEIDKAIDENQQVDQLNQELANGIPTPAPGQITEGEGRVPDQLENDAKANASTGSRVFTKMRDEAETLIEKALERFSSRLPESKYGRKTAMADKRMDALLSRAFREVGMRLTEAKIAEYVLALRTQVPALNTQPSEEGMQAKSWTEFVDDLIEGALITKADDDGLRTRIELLLDELLSEEALYDLDADLWVEQLMEVLKLAYEDGMLATAELVQGELFKRGEVKSPYVGISFNLIDDTVINFLRDTAAELVRNINTGTKYFLRSMITEGALQGLAVDELTRRINNDLFGLPEAEAGKLNRDRIRSIVTTELNRADTFGRLEHMKRLGIQLKRWITRKVEVCELCLDNEALGSVAIDYEYHDVFGPTQGPPGHPRTCHCQLGMDADELNNLKGKPRYWDGSPVEKAALGSNGHRNGVITTPTAFIVGEPDPNRELVVLSPKVEKANPYHKPPGPGGGQFDFSPSSGSAWNGPEKTLSELLDNAGDYTIDELRQRLQQFIEVPISDEKYDYYTHAVRYESEIDSILENGLDPTKSRGRPVTYASQGIVRDRGAGYVVIKVPKGTDVEEGVDYVEPGLSYPEFYFYDKVPPRNIAYVVRPYYEPGWHGTEVDLVRHALQNQGLRDKDVVSLPPEYQRLYDLNGLYEKASVEKYNPYHKPAGTSEGGQFDNAPQGGAKNRPIPKYPGELKPGSGEGLTKVREWLAEQGIEPEVEVESRFGSGTTKVYSAEQMMAAGYDPRSAPLRGSAEWYSVDEGAKTTLPRDYENWEKSSERIMSEDASKFAASLSTEELAAVKQYTGTIWTGESEAPSRTFPYHYEAMNRALRSGPESVSEDIRADVMASNTALAGALNSNRISENAIVYRGIGGTRMPQDLTTLVGTTITDKGFSSMSAHYETAANFGTVVMEVRVPAGSRGAFVRDAATISKWDEFIAPPGSKFNVIGTERRGRVPVLVVELSND